MINRKPLFLALALTFAAPLAFAQSTSPQSATPQSTDAQAAQQAAPTTQTQSTTTTSTTTEQPTGTQGEAAQSNDAWSKDKSTAATPSSSAEPQKKNWSDLDTDKNGTLSVTEAAAVQSLAKAFTEADANADGQLTQDEYKAYLAANGKAATPRSGG